MFDEEIAFSANGDTHCVYALSAYTPHALKDLQTLSAHYGAHLWISIMKTGGDPWNSFFGFCFKLLSPHKVYKALLSPFVEPLRHIAFFPYNRPEALDDVKAVGATNQGSGNVRRG